MKKYLDNPVEKKSKERSQARAEPEPAKHSTGRVLLLDIIKSPYFVSNAEQAPTVVKNNPNLPFVIRESRTQLPGLLTFTLVSNTSKGIISSRYALNHQGELFSLTDNDTYKITVSGNLWDALKADNERVKKRIEKANDLDAVTFTPKQGSTALANKLLVSEKGFFTNSAKPQPASELQRGLNMNP